jgi:hypothetical protein
MLNQIVYASGIPTAIGYWSSGSPQAALVTFTGTSSATAVQPILTIPKASVAHGLGARTKVVVRARARVDLVGATFTAGHTLTLELCTVLGGVVTEIPGSDTTFVIPACTTATQTLAAIDLSPVTITKQAGSEQIALYATLSAAPSAGSIEVVEASIEIDVA